MKTNNTIERAGAHTQAVQGYVYYERVEETAQEVSTQFGKRFALCAHSHTLTHTVCVFVYYCAVKMDFVQGRKKN